MLRFDLNDLRIFLSLTHTLNIAQAADMVGLTPSAVSLRLKKLEEAFGNQLFVRDPRGLILTPAGVALQKEAKRLSEGAAQLEVTMASFLHEDDRELVIASNTTGLQNYFAPYISTFLRKHPGRCRFIECSSAYAQEAVRDGSVDLGFGLITPKVLKDKALSVRDVGLDKHVLITPLDHPLAHSEPIAYVQALIYPQITTSHLSPMSSAMKERATQSGAALLPMLQLPSFDLIIKVVSEGTGVAVVPESSLQHHPNQVAVVELTDSWAERRLGFFLPASRTPAPRALHFVKEFTSL